jgi:hypothetical protein
MLGKVYGISKQPEIHPNILKRISCLAVDTVGLHCTHQAISVTEENKVCSLLESCTHKGIV